MTNTREKQILDAIQEALIVIAKYWDEHPELVAEINEELEEND